MTRERRAELFAEMKRAVREATDGVEIVVQSEINRRQTAPVPKEMEIIFTGNVIAEMVPFEKD